MQQIFNDFSSLTWCFFLVSAQNLSLSFAFCRLESAAVVSKSDIAATKLRYEQQVNNLQTELNSQQV